MKVMQSVKRSRLSEKIAMLNGEGKYSQASNNNEEKDNNLTSNSLTRLSLYGGDLTDDECAEYLLKLTGDHIQFPLTMGALINKIVKPLETKYFSTRRLKYFTLPTLSEDVLSSIHRNHSNKGKKEYSQGLVNMIKSLNIDLGKLNPFFFSEHNSNQEFLDICHVIDKEIDRHINFLQELHLPLKKHGRSGKLELNHELLWNSILDESASNSKARSELIDTLLTHAPDIAFSDVFLDNAFKFSVQVDTSCQSLAQPLHGKTSLGTEVVDKMLDIYEQYLEVLTSRSEFFDILDRFTDKGYMQIGTNCGWPLFMSRVDHDQVKGFPDINEPKVYLALSHKGKLQWLDEFAKRIPNDISVDDESLLAKFNMELNHYLEEAFSDSNLWDVPAGTVLLVVRTRTATKRSFTYVPMTNGDYKVSGMNSAVNPMRLAYGLSVIDNFMMWPFISFQQAIRYSFPGREFSSEAYGGFFRSLSSNPTGYIFANMDISQFDLNSPYDIIKKISDIESKYFENAGFYKLLAYRLRHLGMLSRVPYHAGSSHVAEEDDYANLKDGEALWFKIEKTGLMSGGFHTPIESSKIIALVELYYRHIILKESIEHIVDQNFTDISKMKAAGSSDVTHLTSNLGDDLSHIAPRTKEGLYELARRVVTYKDLFHNLGLEAEPRFNDNFLKKHLYSGGQSIPFRVLCQNVYCPENYVQAHYQMISGIVARLDRCGGLFCSDPYEQGNYSPNYTHHMKTNFDVFLNLMIEQMGRASVKNSAALHYVLSFKNLPTIGLSKLNQESEALMIAVAKYLEEVKVTNQRKKILNNSDDFFGNPDLTTSTLSASEVTDSVVAAIMSNGIDDTKFGFKTNEDSQQVEKEVRMIIHSAIVGNEFARFYTSLLKDQYSTSGRALIDEFQASDNSALNMKLIETSLSYLASWIREYLGIHNSLAKLTLKVS